VSGTGTNVGKTYVATALVAALAEEGPVCGLKPFESGHPGPLGSDQAALGAASTDTASSLRFPLRCFPLPVAPPEAARAAGASVDVDTFLADLDRLCAFYVGTIVLELAGGLFSPFDDRRSNADVLLAIAPDAHVLVAPNRLGVLHDVRATWIAARASGLRFDGVALSHPPGAGEDPSCATNAQGVAVIAGTEPIMLPAAPLPEARATLRASRLFATLRHR
jgi:dethiobiotin synthetase